MSENQIVIHKQLQTGRSAIDASFDEQEIRLGMVTPDSDGQPHPIISWYKKIWHEPSTLESMPREGLYVPAFGWERGQWYDGPIILKVGLKIIPLVPMGILGTFKYSIADLIEGFRTFTFVPEQGRPSSIPILGSLQHAVQSKIDLNNLQGQCWSLEGFSGSAVDLMAILFLRRIFTDIEWAITDLNDSIPKFWPPLLKSLKIKHRKSLHGFRETSCLNISGLLPEIPNEIFSEILLYAANNYLGSVKEMVLKNF